MLRYGPVGAHGKHVPTFPFWGAGRATIPLRRSPTESGTFVLGAIGVLTISTPQDFWPGHQSRASEPRPSCAPRLSAHCRTLVFRGTNACLPRCGNSRSPIPLPVLGRLRRAQPFLDCALIFSAGLAHRSSSLAIVGRSARSRHPILLDAIARKSRPVAAEGESAASPDDCVPAKGVYGAGRPSETVS
jgi:hypothetical protein